MPRLVPCRCCRCGCVAFAVCSVCEARLLERDLERRGLVAREHPSSNAWDRLVASYCGDADDREYDRAVAHELEAADRG